MSAPLGLTRRSPRPANRAMRTRVTCALAVALAASGCSESIVPDLNNPSLEGVTSNPTRAQVQSLATGLVLGNRDAIGNQIRDLEIVGRDAYNLDAADPRWITELLIAFDPGGFGGRHWGGRYRTVKAADVMVQSVATAGLLSGSEKSAATGFAQTIKGLELLSVLETRDTAGIAVEAGATPTDLPPILCRDPALARIAALLDSARTALAAGGTAFPFVLPAGFVGFDTPTTFARVNRAIKARAEVYRAQTDPTANARALAALAESFIDSAAALDRGVNHVFSLAAGDTPNPLYQDPATTNFRVHPSVRADAEAGDRRILTKTALGSAKTYQGVGSSVVFSVYSGPTAPIPIIRNEELILLRAQANLGLGNLGAAQADLNTIRVKSGGLAPRSYASAAAALDDLLRQKRYSLLWESGSRWIDARRYGRLGTLPIDAPTHRVQPIFPIPQEELLARPSGAACVQA